METRRTRRTFSPEFKLAAVRRCIEGHEKPANVAQELDISVVSLYQWIKEFEKDRLASQQGSLNSPAPAPEPSMVSQQKEPTKPEGEASDSKEERPSQPLTQVETRKLGLPKKTQETTHTNSSALQHQRTNDQNFKQKIQLKTKGNQESSGPRQSIAPAVKRFFDFETNEPSVASQKVETPTKVAPVASTEKTVAPQASKSTEVRSSPPNTARPQQQAPKHEATKPHEAKERQNDKPNRQTPHEEPQETNAQENKQKVVQNQPPRPVPLASQGRSWMVKNALSQRPNYKAEGEAFGYVDEFSVPADNLNEVWAILEQMQKNIDKRAFAEMVHSKGINVPREVLEDPRGATVPGPNVPNKPWLRKPRMHQVAEEFFQTTPEYSRSVYETYGGLTMRLDKNSEGTPIYEIKRNINGGKDITIDFSKFDRFVDDFYGDFVRDCKQVMMEQNPKEYPSLNAFIRIPDEPMWNPKLWAGLRTFNWRDDETLAHAWIRHAQSLRKRPQRGGY